MSSMQRQELILKKMKERGIEVGSGIPNKKYCFIWEKKNKGTFANKIIDQYKNSKKLFIISFVPNQIYCLAGYWIEAVCPGKFESILYQKTKRKINEYKNTKKEVDEFIKGINLEYKSIKKEINEFF